MKTVGTVTQTPAPLVALEPDGICVGSVCGAGHPEAGERPDYRGVQPGSRAPVPACEGLCVFGRHSWARWSRASLGLLAHGLLGPAPLLVSGCGSGMENLCSWQVPR